MKILKFVTGRGAICLNILFLIFIFYLLPMPTDLKAQNPSSAVSFSYNDYEAVMQSFVDNDGLVDYKGLKADRDRLDAFADSIAKIDKKTFAKWSEKEKIAFWINAYNGLTLKTIIDNYPIKPTFPASIIHPKNSIRQIPGVWDKLKFSIMDDKLTLDDIEHNILRQDFNEPRIHFAIVCASISCAKLSREAYTADNLDARLESQTRQFLNNRGKFFIDREKGAVYLSPYFKWFGRDFVKSYGTDEKYLKRSQTERASLNFISGYLDEKDREYLLSAKYSITYLDYDWSLNEQKAL
jgi:hypothetical protein